MAWGLWRILRAIQTGVILIGVILVLSSVKIRMQFHVSFDVRLPCYLFSAQDANHPTDEIDVFIFAEAHDRISRIV